MSDPKPVIPGYRADVPSDWNLTTVDGLAIRVGSGITPTGGSEVYQSDGVLFIRSQNVKFEGLDLSDIAYIDEKTNEAMASSEVRALDVLINITGASIGRCCVVPDGLGKANQNQHVCTIRLDSNEWGDSAFLAAELSSPIGQSQIAKFNAGGNREGLNYAQLRSFHLPWPSKLERQKIAEVLSTVDRAIEQTDALIAKQQRLKTGLMQDLLTRGIDEHGNLRSESTHQFKDSPLGRIPVEWEVMDVASIISGIDAGWSPSCEDVTPGQGEWGVLKVSAISSGVYNPTESKRLPSELKPIESLQVLPNDVLISRANGVTELVGRCVFVNWTPAKLMLSDKTLRLKPRLSKIEPFMLATLLATADARRQILNFISGSSGQKNLSQSQIGALQVALPPLKEQHLICAIISKISQQLENDRETLQKLRSLKTALMQDLLTGRRRVTSLLKNPEVSA